MITLQIQRQDISQKINREENNSSTLNKYRPRSTQVNIYLSNAVEHSDQGSG